MILSSAIYIYVVKSFEQDALEKFSYKAKVFSNFLEQSPEIFWTKKIRDKKLISELVKLNDAHYLVLEDKHGNIIDAVNIEWAEQNLYIFSRQDSGISEDQKVFKVSLSLYDNGMPIGKIYVGFDAALTVANLHRTKLLTALFSLSICLIGIIITYFLSSISFKPLTKLISAIDKIKNGEKEIKLDYSNNDEIGILSEKINSILAGLDKSSNQAESLNSELREAFKIKIIELDSEISQRKKAELSLRKSEEQFGLVFENAPIGMVVVSTDNHILSVNKSFCDTTGFDREELIGVPLKLLFDGGEKQVRFVTSADQETEIVDLNSEKILVKKNNEKVAVIVKSVIIYDHNSNPKHTIVQVMDISEIKKVQHELINALEKAEESNRLKSAFLAQMSHEIRTPLNVILTSVPILADEIGEKDNDTQTIINSVGSAGKRLQRTIDMILNLSAVQSGNYKPDFEVINIENELRKLVGEVRSLSDEKGLELIFTSSVKDPYVYADIYTVNQIFQNLIGNSIKYTHRGFIKVMIEDTINDSLVIHVQDTGIGMSKEFMDKIFSPFSQEDIGQKRQYEGNGLGLALVKKYVEINNANIGVQSRKKKGSVFSVVFKKHNELEAVHEKTDKVLMKSA
jgi:PAS domain S-box-containing protein